MGSTIVRRGDGPGPRVIFFTGTDTEVGKTHVAALAASQWRHSGKCVAVYKPVASGCEFRGGQYHSGDALALWQAAGRRGRLEDVCPQRFIAPLAPPAAAASQGTCVDEALLAHGIDAVSDGADLVIVEGAGGLLSPLSAQWLNSDLAMRLRAEVVIVAANRLGVIHQVLATVLAAKSLRLPILGIVLNQVDPLADASVPSNAETIRRFTRVPLLGLVTHGATASEIRWDHLPMAAAVHRGGSDELTQAWL